MFFQSNDENKKIGEQSAKEFKDAVLKELSSLIDPSSYLDNLIRIEDQAAKVNQTFGQTRARIGELNVSVRESTAEILRLGGTYSDVGATISNLALASRRNVVATSDEVEKLFAASKILGESSEVIASNFIDAGFVLGNVSDQVKTSVNYIQSIGGNVSQVYDKILKNTEKLNRFQFENGVQGLTKMAAQASMLRFDMNQTFQLADKVLSPEGAIEVASAFQRLGVAAGNLADPFQLMNQSINDPQGLQDSLIDVAKQFTYFDDKTKSFKINPQGVLTLREIERQTGVSAKEMTKLGLAASELDSRLSQISPSIQFDNDEDKQFLANIGRMGKDGKYEVKIPGSENFKKLSELQQTEINELINQQKRANESLEVTAVSHMGVSELILSETKSMVFQLQTIALKSDVLKDTLGVNIIQGYSDIRKSVDDSRSKISQSIIGVATILAEKLGKEVKAGFEAYSPINRGGNLGDFTEKYVNRTLVERQVKDVISPSIGTTKISTKEGELLRLSPNDDVVAAPNLIDIIGKIGNDQRSIEPLNNLITSLGNKMGSSSVDQKIEFTGSPTITIKHEFPAEMSSLNRETKMKIADEIVNSPQLVQQIQNNFAKITNGTTFRPINSLNTNFGGKV
jgi:hypothetical protein